MEYHFEPTHGAGGPQFIKAHNLGSLEALSFFDTPANLREAFLVDAAQWFLLGLRVEEPLGCWQASFC